MLPSRAEGRSPLSLGSEMATGVSLSRESWPSWDPGACCGHSMWLGPAEWGKRPGFGCRTARRDERSMVCTALRPGPWWQQQPLQGGPLVEGAGPRAGWAPRGNTSSARLLRGLSRRIPASPWSPLGQAPPPPGCHLQVLCAPWPHPGPGSPSECSKLGPGDQRSQGTVPGRGPGGVLRGARPFVRPPSGDIRSRSPTSSGSTRISCNKC